MSTQTDAEIERLSHPPAEQRIIVPNVSWKTYESFLADLANQSSIRLTYDRGILEIMSPLTEHERLKHIIELMVEILAEELSIEVECFGSTTFKREDLARGFEPDSCFYIQHEASISDKTNIDLTIDPSPDLVIEIDITSSSLNKFPIYSAIGVPEIWRHDRQKLYFFKLSGKDYIETDNSLAFPPITSAGISGFIEKSKTLKKRALVNSFREWVRNL